MTTLDVGKKLVELCKQGKNLEAIETLYDKNIVSVEAAEMPGHPATMKGKEAVLGKSKWWVENHTIHSATALGPFPNGDRFAAYFKYEVTPKATGKKMTMEEVAFYTVKNGLITHEEFFYDMQGK